MRKRLVKGVWKLQIKSSTTPHKLATEYTRYKEYIYKLQPCNTKLEQRMNIFSTGRKYRRYPIGIPDVSGIHGFSGTALNLLLSISNFKSNCRYLLDMTIYTDNLHKSKSNTNIEWNANWDMIFVLPKFRLVWVLLSIEGATGNPAKVSPRGYH